MTICGTAHTDELREKAPRLRFEPGVCVECAAAERARRLEQLRSFECQELFVQPVAQRPGGGGARAATPAAAQPSPAASSKVGGGGESAGVLTPGATMLAPARRSRRRSIGAKASVVASSFETVRHLKLLIFQALETPPAQQCLYFDGALLEEDRTLEASEVFPGAMLQLFVDESVPADDARALDESLSAALGRGRESVGGRTLEGGFAGSALLGGC